MSTFVLALLGAAVLGSPAAAAEPCELPPGAEVGFVDGSLYVGQLRYPNADPFAQRKLGRQLLACGFSEAAGDHRRWRRSRAWPAAVGLGSAVLLFPPITPAGVIGLAVATPVTVGVTAARRQEFQRSLSGTLHWVAALPPPAPTAAPPTVVPEPPPVAPEPPPEEPPRVGWDAVALDEEAAGDLAEIEALLARSSALLAARSRAHAVADAIPRAEERVAASGSEIDELVGDRADLGVDQRAAVAALAARLATARQEAVAAAARADESTTPEAAAEAVAVANALLGTTKVALREAGEHVESVRAAVARERAQAEARVAAEQAWRRRNRDGGTMLVAGTGVLAGAVLAGIVGDAHNRPSDPVCAADPVRCSVNGWVYVPAVGLGVVGVGLGAVGVAWLGSDAPAHLELRGRF